MRFCRFEQGGATGFGLVENLGGTEMITRTVSVLPRSFGDFEGATSAALPLADVRILAPTQPSKIVCIGRNYREHAKEFDSPVPQEPLIFLKPPSAVIAPGDSICRPHLLSDRIDHEGELGVVIGERCYRMRSGQDVRPYILGYTCVNDVTARDLQKRDGQWSRAKGFDTFCPFGPVVAGGLDPWKGLQVETRVNGDLRQCGTTSDFIFALDVILHFVTRVMTLEPGDLIATGTPAGVGPLQPGDTVEVTVEGVGTLRNPVVNL
jgi:2-keto-4-pentenoate hydratase/2-oxohepta-3-ene-1,7-dioic acid hydratase in catechol pathway